MKSNILLFDGACNGLVDLEDIDIAIREFIIFINSYDDVETRGSCSGHPGFYQTQAYIYFKDTKNENFKKVLDLFEKIGFSVRKERDIGWWHVGIKLDNKNKKDITQKNIGDFWKYIKERFLEEMN